MVSVSMCLPGATATNPQSRSLSRARPLAGARYLLLRVAKVVRNALVQARIPHMQPPGLRSTALISIKQQPGLLLSVLLVLEEFWYDTHHQHY